MGAVSISVSHETRKLLDTLKTSGETYDDVIRGLIISLSKPLTPAEIARRVREGHRNPIKDLIAKSRG
jgi:hypothetical protein